jgi:hypothetical protein
MQTIKYWVFRVLSFISLDLHLYYLWSRFGRWLFERPYLYQAIHKYVSADELASVMRPWQWRPDPWWQLWDMISCPKIVETKGLAKLPVGDCDDFSVYAGTALSELQENAGAIHGPGGLGPYLCKNFSLLTIPWMTKDGQLEGHNICVFQYYDIAHQTWFWSWVSNWFACEIQWTHETDLRPIIKRVVGDGKNLRWARVSLDLKTVYETGTES